MTESTGQILKRKYNANGNIGDNNITDNNNNDATKQNDKKYALDRSKFTPNTEESQLAEEMATKLSDLENFAYYFHVVKRIGISGAYRLFKSTLADIEEKKNTKYPVRNIRRYFAWKFKKKMY